MTTSTIPLHYACADGEVVRTGDVLAASAATADTGMRRGWADSDGDHFVAWPHATTQSSAVEYVMPSDAFADAKALVWDTSKGTSRVDWRLVKTGTCAVHGGYSEALALFAGGDSMSEVASKLELEDATAARKLVHDAMYAMQKRYYASFTAAK